MLVEGVDGAPDVPDVDGFSVLAPPDFPAPLSDEDAGVFALLGDESDPRESVR